MKRLCTFRENDGGQSNVFVFPQKKHHMDALQRNISVLLNCCAI